MACCSRRAREKVFTLNPTATAVVREIASGDERDDRLRASRTASTTSGDAIEREVIDLHRRAAAKGLVEG